jgi:hypothetical protein
MEDEMVVFMKKKNCGELGTGELLNIDIFSLVTRSSKPVPSTGDLKKGFIFSF